MTQCVVGQWRESLDQEDKEAFSRVACSVRPVNRAALYATICKACGEKPYGLTALKQHLNGRCACN